MSDTPGPSAKRLQQPDVRQGAKFGIAVGAAYALAGSVYVLLRGGTPESWGHATLPEMILLEIGGGALGGALVGLLSPLARFWVGAVLVMSIGLSPMVVGVMVLVEGPRWINICAGLIASSLMGLIIGHNLWRNDSRFWGAGDSQDQ